MKKGILTSLIATTVITIVFTMSLLLNGCAPVKVFSDAELTRNTGLKFYSVKPYLQVERDMQTGAIVKTSVIYLPDLAHPQYVAVRDGLGSRKLDLKLTDGMITSFATTTENMIPETLEAIAAVTDKSAEAIKDISINGIPSALQSITAELYELIISEDGTTLKRIEIK